MSEYLGNRRTMATISGPTGSRRALRDIAAHTPATSLAARMVVWYLGFGEGNAAGDGRDRTQNLHGREGERPAMDDVVRPMSGESDESRRPECSITRPIDCIGQLARWWNIRQWRRKGWEDPEESWEWYDRYREWQRNWQESQPDIPITNDLFPTGKKRR
jgi:hypothetical protein